MKSVKMITSLLVLFLLTPPTLAWCSWEEMDSGVTIDLMAIWGDSNFDVYVVGQGTDTILHFDGYEWNDMGVSLNGVPLNDIWGTDSGNVYALGKGYGGNIYRYDGTSWSDICGEGADYAYNKTACELTKNNLFLQAISARAGDGLLGEDRVYVVGQQYAGPTAYLVYNGTEWTSEIFNSEDFSSLVDVLPLSEGTYFLSLNELYINNKDTKLNPPGQGVCTSNSYCSSLRGFSGNDIYISLWNVSAGVLSSLHFDGADWLNVEVIQGVGAIVYPIAPDDRFAMSGNNLYYDDGSGWVQVEIPENFAVNVRDIWGLPGGDVFAVGNGGKIWRYERGIPEEPDIRLFPGILTFSTNVDQPQDRTLQIMNAGNEDLEIGSIASSNPLAAPFSIINNSCSGKTLGPLAWCELTVRFQPTAEQSFQDTFDIPSNDPDTPQLLVEVHGVGKPAKPKSDGNTPGAEDQNDPVSTATGELYFSETDMDIGGPLPLIFSRYYASMLNRDGHVNSALGDNWMHNFDLSLEINGDDIEVVYYRGKTIPFYSDGNGWFLLEAEQKVYQLVKSGDLYRFMDPEHGLIFSFDTNGLLTRIEDRNGNAHTLSYTEKLLTRVSDGLGRWLDFTYSSGKLVRVTDQTGRHIDFSHTGENLTSFTDALGNITRYEYTSIGGTTGLMTGKINPVGNIPYTQTWDGQARVATQADSTGNITGFTYLTAPNITTTVRDPLGNEFKHLYKDFALLRENLDQSGQTYSIDYDANHRRTQITDRLGDSTNIGYHAATGKITSFTDTALNTTSLTYSDQAQGDFSFYNLSRVDYADGTFDLLSHDACGNLIQLTDRGGQIWQYTYNDQGLVLKATNPDGGVTTNSYNADGTLASQTDHFGNTLNYSYDELKRLQQINLADGNSRSYIYDANDNILSAANELGRITQFSYDNNNNLETITDADARTITMGYDGNNRIISILDRMNQSTTRVYDALGRLQSRTNALGDTASLGYDVRGWLKTYTDPAGHSWSRTHDNEGVVVSTTNPLGQTWSYQSDKLGRITTITSPRQHQQKYTYDPLGRLSNYTDPLGKTTAYSYDSRGLLTGLSLPGGIASSYSRNSLGLITTVTDPNGNSWNRSYDQAGRMTERRDPMGNSWSYAYDVRDRISKIDFPASEVNLTYDAVGNLLRRLYSDGTDLNYSYDNLNRLISSNGLSLSYDANNNITASNGIAITRDAVGRIQSVTLAAGKTFNYGYDSRGLVSEVDDWVGGKTTLTYDNAGRLINITRPNGVSTIYSYDNDGRLTGISEESDSNLSTIALILNARGEITGATRDLPLHPVLTRNIQTYSYDAASQVAGWSHDAMGRVTYDGTRHYSWDLASRLTGYTQNGTDVTFSYDGLGMCISRTQEDVMRSYVWNYAMELASISVIRQGNSDLSYYIHLPDGRLLHSIEAADNTRHYYHFDEVGNTVFLTSESGIITDSYGITPYGLLTAHTGSSDNPFTFSGAYGVMAEGDSGLYYMRARYYNAAIGRFIARDPVQSTNPREIAPYLYAKNNPMLNVDPTGLNPEEAVPAKKCDGKKENKTDRRREVPNYKPSKKSSKPQPKTTSSPARGDNRYPNEDPGLAGALNEVVGNYVIFEYNPCTGKNEVVPDAHLQEKVSGRQFAGRPMQ